jgi:hypothetical protein
MIHDAFYKFQPLKFDECIKTANVVINAMSSKSQKEWIIFDAGYYNSSRRSLEVLCYVPGCGYNGFPLRCTRTAVSPCAYHHYRRTKKVISLVWQIYFHLKPLNQERSSMRSDETTKPTNQLKTWQEYTGKLYGHRSPELLLRALGW